MPLTSVTLEASHPSPVAYGTEVVFTATPTGGSDHEYRFWLRTDGTWELKQDWSLDNTWTWQFNYASTYRIQVDARADSILESERILDYIVLDPPTEIFNIFRCLLNRDTGRMIGGFTLIEEEIELDEILGVFEYNDTTVISNEIYGYIVYPVEDVGMPMDSDIYVHYLLDFLVNTLGIDEIGLEDLVRLHGEVTETVNLPIVNLISFEGSNNTAYGKLVEISELASVDVYFEYRLSTSTGDWSTTTPKTLVAVGDFDEVIVVATSGNYHVRSAVEFTVNTKNYKLLSNTMLVFITAV